MTRDVRGSCMEEETWRGREGVVGCGRYLSLRMGSLGGGGGQVLPPSMLENQGQGIAQTSDPLPSELAPPNPSLISPLLSPALHGRPPRPRPLPWLSLPPHHPLRPLPPHLPPPRPCSSPTGPRRLHCPCLCPPTAFLPLGCGPPHHPTTPPCSPLAPPCPHPHPCCRCQGTLGPQLLTPFLVSLGSWPGGWGAMALGLGPVTFGTFGP